MRRGPISLAKLFAFYKMCGGFPLHLVPTKATTVDRDSRVLCLRPLVAGLLMMVTYAFVLYETCNIYAFAPAEFINNLAKGLGTSTFLVYVLYCISIYILVIGFVSYILILWRRKRICAFYASYSHLEKFVGEKRTDYALGEPTLITWLFSCMVLVTIGCVMYSVVCYKACMDFTHGEPMTWVRWIYIFTLALERLWTLNNPMVISVSILCMDYVLALRDLLSQWKHALEKLSVFDKDFKNKFKTHLKFGGDLCILAEEANVTMAPFNLLSYVYFFVGGVMYFYGAFDIVFSTDKIKEQAALLSVTYATFAVAWFYGFAMTANMGDDVYDQRDAVVRTLDMIVLECQEGDLNDNLVYGLNGLIRQLNNIKIAPYNYFEVRNSTFIAMMATVATYLIIVLQFRAS